MSRLVKIGDALSQLANVALMPRVSETTANESISGRAHRQGWRKLKRLINAIFFWQDDHCKMAYDSDVQRARELIAAHDQE